MASTSADTDMLELVTSPTKFHFFTLPFEIRITVYRHVFCHTRVVYEIDLDEMKVELHPWHAKELGFYRSNGHDVDGSPATVKIHRFTSDHEHNALLQVSHQCYQEALQPYFQSCIFHFVVKPTSPSYLTDYAWRADSPRSLDLRQFAFPIGLRERVQSMALQDRGLLENPHLPVQFPNLQRILLPYDNTVTTIYESDYAEDVTAIRVLETLSSENIHRCCHPDVEAAIELLSHLPTGVQIQICGYHSYIFCRSRSLRHDFVQNNDWGWHRDFTVSVNMEGHAVRLRMSMSMPYLATNRHRSFWSEVGQSDDLLVFAEEEIW